MHAITEIFEPARDLDVRRAHAHRHRRGVEVRHQRLERRRTVERHRAGEALVEDDAERVDVGARVDLAAVVDLLGRHVLRRPDECALLRELLGAVFVADDFDDPEIDDFVVVFSVARRHQDDVRRLQVAVDDPLRVRFREAARDRVGDADRLLGRQPAERVDAAAERLTRQELHRDEEARRLLPLDLAVVEHRDDVRVLELREDARLAREALLKLRVVLARRPFDVQHLQRDVATERHLLGAVHLPHSADRDERADLVLAVDDATDEGVGRRRGARFLTRRWKAGAHFVSTPHGSRAVRRAARTTFTLP